MAWQDPEEQAAMQILEMLRGQTSTPQSPYQNEPSLSRIAYEQALKNDEHAALMKKIQGAAALGDVGLQRIGQLGQKNEYFTGLTSPYGGQINPGRNPGLMQLMMLLQSSNQHGWG